MPLAAGPGRPTAGSNIDPDQMPLIGEPVTDLDATKVRDPLAATARLGGVPVTVHDHLCVFFRGREERDRLLLPNLRDGLRAGHTCLCATADGESADLVALAGRPDLDIGLLHTVEAKTPT